MARLKKIPPFTGTRDGICVYRMHGEFFVRTASSLTGKRVKTDPAFKKTMANASRFAQASALSSKIYLNLPLKMKKPHIRYELIRVAMEMLGNGMDAMEIEDILKKNYH